MSTINSKPDHSHAYLCSPRPPYPQDGVKAATKHVFYLSVSLHLYIYFYICISISYILYPILYILLLQPITYALYPKSTSTSISTSTYTSEPLPIPLSTSASWCPKDGWGILAKPCGSGRPSRGSGVPGRGLGLISWVAARELRLRYHKLETMPFTL